MWVLLTQRPSLDAPSPSSLDVARLVLGVLPCLPSNNNSSYSRSCSSHSAPGKPVRTSSSSLLRLHTFTFCFFLLPSLSSNAFLHCRLLLLTSNRPLLSIISSPATQFLSTTVSTGMLIPITKAGL
jgi:hypothetical protein